MDVLGALQSVDWTNPTLDLIIVAGFLGGALLYGFSLGRDRIVVMMVSMYVALAVVSFVPQMATWNTSIQIHDLITFKLLAFLGVFFVLFFALSQNDMLRSLGEESYGNIPQVALFSILHIGLLMSVGLSFLPYGALNGISPLTYNALLSDTAKAIWVTAPVVAMAIFRSRY